MNNKAVICAIAAFSVSVSGLAVAQGGPDMATQDGQGRWLNGGAPRSEDLRQRGDRGYNNQNDRQTNRGDRVDQRNRGDQRDRGDHQRARDGRGAGPDHRFYRGGRLPQEYRSRQYVVEDWRGHRLSAPPRGYQWVQTGGDYVLAAIATGVILSIILNQ